MIFLLTRAPGDWGYDENVGFVISAKNETTARAMANDNACDEGKIWDDKNRIKCEIVTNKTPAGIVLRSFNAG